MSVGMPGNLKLHEFGSQVWAAFGEAPFHVGSSLTEKAGWRDVDVRLILQDDDWEAMGLGDPSGGEFEKSEKWWALCLAFCALGREMTGLPVDFQIQQATHANKAYGPGPRSALGLVPLRRDDEHLQRMAEAFDPADTVPVTDVGEAVRG